MDKKLIAAGWKNCQNTYRIVALEGKAKLMVLNVIFNLY